MSVKFVFGELGVWIYFYLLSIVVLLDICIIESLLFLLLCKDYRMIIDFSIWKLSFWYK